METFRGIDLTTGGGSSDGSGSVDNAQVEANTANININAGHIDENRSDIADNTAAIEANAANIASNDTDIAALQTETNTNATNISNNTTAIENNTTAIETNTNAIQSNTDAIQTNTSNIQSNTDAINNLETSVNTNTTNITNINNDISDLEDRATTNESGIATNVTNIQTNADDIDALETGVNALTTTVDNNTTAIQTNASNISNNTTSIQDNTQAITNLGTDVEGLETDITANTANIQTNTNNITTNTTDITALEAGLETANANIQTNADNIASNDTDIAALQAATNTNSSNISNNTTAINTNTANIQTNADDIDTLENSINTVNTDISDLEDKVDTNTTNITSNANSIFSNTTAIETNATNITGNTTSINNLTATVNSNTTAINNNAGNIQSNTDAIEELSADISGFETDLSNLQTSVTNNTTNITANANDIDALENRVDTNENNIASNVTAIATNATHITSNTDLINALTTKVNTNTDNIATNVTNIANNTTAINSNASGIQNNATDIAALQNSTHTHPNKAVIDGFSVTSGILYHAGKKVIISDDVVDNLESDDNTKVLSAKQGKVLKQYIDSINDLLSSDDINLDELQEIVDFIKANKNTLENLGISNITGLQAALDLKADKVDVDNNTAAIEANATAIQTNETNIQTNADGIDALETALDSLQSSNHTHDNKVVLDGFSVVDNRLIHNTKKLLITDDIVDDLVTDDATKVLSSKQGKVLKDLIDVINAKLVSDDSDLDTLQEIVTFIKANKAELDSLNIDSIDGLQAALDLKADKVDVDTLTNTVNTNTNDIDTLEASVASNTTNIQANTDDIAALEASTHTHDNMVVLNGFSVVSDVLNFNNVPVIIKTDIADNLTTDDNTKVLSAKQGTVIKTLIDNITATLASDDVNLDTIQEIVDFIKVNRSTLDNLGISDVNGLQDALDLKADKTTVDTNTTNIQSNTDAISTLQSSSHTHSNLVVLDGFSLSNGVLQHNNKRVLIGDDIADDLTTADSNKVLSAKQGKVLKGYIDNIYGILTSNDTSLDELQEIVDFIKSNKNILDNLHISNIDGLQDALDLKANQADLDTTNTNVQTNADAIAALETSNHTHDNKEVIDKIVLDSDVLKYDGHTIVLDTIVQDSLTSTSVTNSLSANQGRLLKGQLDTLANTVSDHTDTIDENTSAIEEIIENQVPNIYQGNGEITEPREITIDDNAVSFVGGMASYPTVEITSDNDSGGQLRLTSNDIKGEFYASKWDVGLYEASTNTLPWSFDVASKVLATGRIASLGSYNYRTKFRILSELQDYDGNKGTVGQVLQPKVDNGNVIGVEWVDNVDGTTVVDNLTSTSASDALSANQGKILKGLIDNINTLLTSDDTTLDELQEIVDYIKQNKEDLSNLGINNISGLQNALDLKADKVDVENNADNIDSNTEAINALGNLVNTNVNNIDTNTEAINDLQASTHSHVNKAVIDKFTEYNSEPYYGTDLKLIVATDVEDNLTSTAYGRPLSANQGRVLKNMINAKHTIYDADGTLTSDRIVSIADKKLSFVGDDNNDKYSTVEIKSNSDRGGQVTVASNSSSASFYASKWDVGVFMESTLDIPWSFDLASSTMCIGRIASINGMDLRTKFRIMGELQDYNGNKGSDGQVLSTKLDNGNVVGVEWKDATVATTVVDNLESTSASDALSANQGRVLKGLIDDNATFYQTDGEITEPRRVVVNSNVITFDGLDAFSPTLEVKSANGSYGGRLAVTSNDIKGYFTADRHGVGVWVSSTNKMPWSFDVASGVTAIGRISGLGTVSEYRTKFRILSELQDYDGNKGTPGQVLVPKVDDNGDVIGIAWSNNVEATTVIDNLTSTSITDALSANQGKVLKGLIDNINTLLLSDDSTLDELQEIVNFIKQNKETLDTLGISNISGLQAALDLKADKTTVDELTNTVNSNTTNIATLQASSHTHSNKDTLDNLSSSSGRLIFDSKYIISREQVSSSLTSSSEDTAASSLAVKNIYDYARSNRIRIYGLGDRITILEDKAHTHDNIAVLNKLVLDGAVLKYDTSKILLESNVIDNRSSTSTTDALSANQGRLLQSQITTARSLIDDHYENPKNIYSQDGILEEDRRFNLDGAKLDMTGGEIKMSDVEVNSLLVGSGPNQVKLRYNEFYLLAKRDSETSTAKSSFLINKYDDGSATGMYNYLENGTIGNSLYFMSDKKIMIKIASVGINREVATYGGDALRDQSDNVLITKVSEYKKFTPIDYLQASMGCLNPNPRFTLEDYDYNNYAALNGTGNRAIIPAAAKMSAYGLKVKGYGSILVGSRKTTYMNNVQLRAKIRYRGRVVGTAVDPSKEYKFRMYIGTKSYDFKNNFIFFHTSSISAVGRESTLAQPLRNGDTSVTIVTPATQFYNYTSMYHRGLRLYRKQPNGEQCYVQDGVVYEHLSYSRWHMTRLWDQGGVHDNGDGTTTITFNRAWDMGDFEIGDGVVNLFEGGTYSYWLYDNYVIEPNEFGSWHTITSNWRDYNQDPRDPSSSFRPGTAYARLILLPNYKLYENGVILTENSEHMTEVYYGELALEWRHQD